MSTYSCIPHAALLLRHLVSFFHLVHILCSVNVVYNVHHATGDLFRTGVGYFSLHLATSQSIEGGGAPKKFKANGRNELFHESQVCAKGWGMIFQAEASDNKNIITLGSLKIGP